MGSHASRRAVLVGSALALALAGCTGTGGDVTERSPTRTTSSTGGGTTAGGTTASVGSPPTAATRLPVAYGFEKLRTHVVSGGPPRDGIPSVDDLPLERVYAYDAMWFAWAGFYPETALVETAD